ncbi:MAG: hypothetical protein C5B51_01360 [Terriglobia bacterium]|nr:MAG: hypothetical protein C5B51_01360 [Terriglobia bacterium]
MAVLEDSTRRFHPFVEALKKAMLRKLFTMLPLWAAYGFGQRFEMGAEVGVPVTPAFETGSSRYGLGFGEKATSATRRYTVGPMAGLWFPHGFGVEVDALYTRLGFDHDLYQTALVTHTRVTANSWELPILGQIRFRGRSRPGPFVEAGISFRFVSGVSAISVATLSFYGPVGSSTGTTSAVLNNRSTRGAVAGVGVDLGGSFLRLRPEIRYTRWGSDRNLETGPGRSYPIPVLYSNQNQAEVLLGIVFRP